MTITCSICGENFTSLMIEGDKAIAEISDQFVKHITRKHIMTVGAVSRDLSVLLRLATWFISIQFARVAEDEKQFHEQYVKQGEQILRLLGLSSKQIEGVELKHQVRKPDDVAGKQTGGPILA